MDMKRFFLYAIVIAALALAGCGGGGGGTAMTPTEPDPTQPTQPTQPPGPTPEEMALKDAQDAAMAAYMMAMGYADGAKDYVAMGNAMKYADMAKGASDMAAAATTVAMAAEYQMKAEMYRDQAMDAAMMRGLGITNLANKILNQSAIDNAVLEGKTGNDVPEPNSNLKERVGTALDTTVAAAVPDALDTPESSTGAGDGVTDGTVHQGDETSAHATLDDKGRLRFTVTRGTEAVLRGEDPTPLMTSGEKPSGGWPGAELVRTDASPAGKTYVNVYTDINPPTQLYTSPRTDPATAVPITLPTGVGAVARLTADDGVPGDGSSFTGTFNADSTDNNPPVAGQFNCPAGTAGGCAISVDEDGVIKSIRGYEFHPMAGVTKQDADYMTWGVWLTAPDAATDGTFAAATVGAFASGNNPFNVRAELKGTATYNGDATGLYAAGGYVDYFDADVSLTANFGGNVGADNSPDSADNDGLLVGAVSGTVSNITAGGMAVDGSLTLGRAPVVAGAQNGASSNGFRGGTTGVLAGRPMEGMWGGQFYGPNKAPAGEAGAKAAETEFPTTAGGTFGAAALGDPNNPIRILGSFGAWKAD